ncbi:MAG: DMT family transporter [Planctomycetes bacterium]|nr:DMT family transporter [Planctomycetota bacterium]
MTDGPRLRRPADALPGLLAALAFGVGAPAAQRVFAGVGRWTAGAWIALASGTVFLVATRLGLRAPPPGPVTDTQRRRGRVALLVSTGVGPVLGAWCALEGLARLSAHEASLLLNLETLFTPLIAVAVFGERLSPSRWVGAALVLAGGVACAAASGDAPGAGAASGGAPWIAASCLCWATDSNLLRYLVHRDAFTVARDKGLLGGAAAFVAAAATGEVPPLPGAATLAAGAAVGVVGFGAALVGYLVSVRRVGTATTGALFGTGPFVGVLVAWLALGERPGLVFGAAAVAMAAGVGLLVRPHHPGAASHPVPGA